MSPAVRQARTESPSHYDQNGHFTACGQRVSWPERGSGIKPRSVVDHGAATNVEDRVGCQACKDWLRSYRAAFPRAETMPDFVTLAQKAAEERIREDSRYAAEIERREVDRELLAAEAYRQHRTLIRSLGYQVRAR